jgi:hypothetical protein
MSVGSAAELAARMTEMVDVATGPYHGERAQLLTWAPDTEQQVSALSLVQDLQHRPWCWVRARPVHRGLRAPAASLETLDEAGFERGLAVLLAPDPA